MRLPLALAGIERVVVAADVLGHDEHSIDIIEPIDRHRRVRATVERYDRDVGEHPSRSIELCDNPAHAPVVLPLRLQPQSCPGGCATVVDENVTGSHGRYGFRRGNAPRNLRPRNAPRRAWPGPHRGSRDGELDDDVIKVRTLPERSLT